MSDFSAYTGWAIPEGNVVQVADASGRVLWAAVRYPAGTVVLEVEKITSDTYAGNTTYTAEEFILLDIYPKTNGTVSVTYGGLTKTITDTSGAEEPNAQQVFFGTFNGVSDSVETPASGTLTIEGDYQGFAVGAYSQSKLYTYSCLCVTSIKNFGIIEVIPDFAFSQYAMNLYGGCSALAKVTIPSSVKSIGAHAFHNCTSLLDITINDGVTEIGDSAFYNQYAGIDNEAAVRTITMLSKMPPTLKSSDTGEYAVFGGPVTTNFIVPKGCGETYKAAEGWSEYAGRIVEAS